MVMEENPVQNKEYVFLFQWTKDISTGARTGAREEMFSKQRNIFEEMFLVSSVDPSYFSKALKNKRPYVHGLLLETANSGIASMSIAAWIVRDGEPIRMDVVALAKAVSETDKISAYQKHIADDENEMMFHQEQVTRLKEQIHKWRVSMPEKKYLSIKVPE